MKLAQNEEDNEYKKSIVIKKQRMNISDIKF